MQDPTAMVASPSPAARPVASLRLEELAVGPALGDGGEGTVFDVHVPGARRPLVLKRYAAGLDGERRVQLAALVSLRPHLRQAAAGLSWPEALVTEGEAPVGVLMPRAPAPFWATVRLRSGRAQQRLRETQYLLFGEEKLQRLGIPYATLTQRLSLLSTLASALRRIHEVGLVYGDVSARNILYTVDGPPEVFLLDCDGVVPAGTPYVVDSPDWADPARPSTAEHATDVYKLGLLAARVIAVHPTIDHVPPHGGTPAPLVDALAAMLDHDPTARPTVLEVVTALDRCHPGPVEDAAGTLPQWGLRARTGEVVALHVPAPPPSEGPVTPTRGAAPSRRSRRWGR